LCFFHSDRGVLAEWRNLFRLKRDPSTRHEYMASVGMTQSGYVETGTRQRTME